MLIEAPEPIRAIAFDPAGGSCALHAPIRQRTANDGPEVTSPVVALGDAQPLDPLACARPYASADVTHVVAPVIPQMAMEQGIRGTVRVAVTLDATGSVSFLEITSSPSVILNAAALDAVRASTFTPAIFRCKPVADAYLVNILLI